MFRRPNRPLILLLLGFLLAGAAAAEPQERLHLVVLHTNDLHGQVLPLPATWLGERNPPLAGGLPRVAAYANQVRRELAEEGGALLLVDAGDWFQGTPEGAIERGRGFLAALAAVGYDAVCVGNHELDHGLEVFDVNLTTVDVPAVLANVRTPEGELLTGCAAYRIVERGGLRIAIVGLLTPATVEITPPSVRVLQFRDPARALVSVREELAEREPRVDWILPVTHLGVGGDRELARAHPDLELIVGGHSHTVLDEGVREGETLIVQAGSKARSVGRVDLWFDPRNGEVLEKHARLVSLHPKPREKDRNAAVEEICERLVAVSAEEMEQVVGRLAAPLLRSRNRFESCSAGNLIADVLRARMRADVGLHNRGGIRSTVAAGEVTRRALFEMLPFENHLVALEMTGGDLVACLRRAVEGTAHAGLEVSGMTVVVRVEGGRAQLESVLVGGEPLVPDARYLVATNSFLAHGGDGYPELARAAQSDVVSAPLRVAVEDAFRAAGHIDPPAENRYRVVP